MMKLNMRKNVMLLKKMRQNLMMKMKIVHKLRTKMKMQQQILKDQLVQTIMMNLMKLMKVNKLIMKEVARMMLHSKKQK